MPVTLIEGTQIRAGTVTDTQMAAANKDGLGTTPSVRTLGTGAQQAAAGNDSRFLPAYSGVVSVVAGTTSTTFTNGSTGSGAVVLATSATLTSPTFSGTVTLSGMAAGGVLFTGTGGAVSQNAVNLTWDNTGFSLVAGNARLGTWPPNSGFVFFGHNALDQTNAGNYAFMSNSVGDSFFNAAPGRDIYFRLGNATDALHITAAGNVGVQKTNPATALDVSGTITATALTVNGTTTVTATNDATSVSTGCLTLSGGLGVGKSLFVGGPALDLGGAAWVRNDPGTSRLAADVTNATTTLTNLADLSQTVVTGRKYTGRLVLKCNNSTAAGGIKIDLGGGTATMTSFWAVASPAGSAGSGGTIATGTLVSTTLTGGLTYSTITGETLITVEVSFVVSVGGTFIPRVATNSAGTMTAELGSSLWLRDSRN
jgi:hypothetical protein